MQKPSIPKGTRDYSPQEVHKRRYILNTLETVFKKYGFMPIETPTMENLSTLEGKYGDEGDKLLFRVLNSGDAFKSIREQYGKEEVAQVPFKLSDVAEKGLRYDLTVPFARYVVMNRNEITFPFRRYQMQPVWRADRPQKGRYREFWQCDADVVGSDSLLNEVDLIQIYAEAFDQLKIPVQIKYNNRKILDGLSQLLGIPEKLMEMITILDKKDKVGLETIIQELIGIGADPVQLDHFGECLLEQGNYEKMVKFFSANEQSGRGIEELKAVITCLKLSENNVEGRYNHVVHDVALARGLNYYTGAIFEVVALQGTLLSSIGGGGRYDNLTGIFGLPNVSGVGISFGLDRIYDVMEELNLFESVKFDTTKVLVCALDAVAQQYAMAPLKHLRDAGIAAELYPDLKKIGKQLDYANALKIPYAIIIGDQEMETGNLVLKDLQQGTQESLPIATIIARLTQ